MLHTIARSLMLATYNQPQSGAPHHSLPRDPQGEMPRLRWQREDLPFGSHTAGGGHD